MKMNRRPLTSAASKLHKKRPSGQAVAFELGQIKPCNPKITFGTVVTKKTQDVSRVAPEIDPPPQASVQSKLTERSNVKSARRKKKSAGNEPPKLSKSSKKAKGTRVAKRNPVPTKAASNKITDEQIKSSGQASPSSSNPTKPAKKVKPSKHNGLLAPVVNPPVIDMLTAVVHVPRDKREAIMWAVQDLLKPATDDLPKLVSMSPKPGVRYRHRFLVVDKDGKRIGYISFDPLPTKYPIAYFQFRFNPAKKKDGLVDLMVKAVKILLGENARELLASAKINEMDVAYDVHGLPKSTFLTYGIRLSRFGVWGKFFKKDQVVRFDIETTYHGQKKKSTRSVTVYDKRRERSDNGDDLLYDRDCIRIEGSLRPRIPKRDITGKKTEQYGAYLHELHDMPNPFGNLKIAANPMPKGGDWQFDLFMAAVDSIGLNAALAKVKDDTARRRFRKRLAEAQVDWWNPESALKLAIVALKKLSLFPPDAFDPL